MQCRKMIRESSKALADRAADVGRDEGVQDPALAVRDRDAAELVDPHPVEARDAVGPDADVADGEAADLSAAGRLSRSDGGRRIPGVTVWPGVLGVATRGMCSVGPWWASADR